MKATWLISVPVCFVIAPFVLSPKVAAQGYSVTDLGTLGGDGSQAHAINNSGVIVGATMTANGNSVAFRFINDSISELGIKGSPSTATAINGSGQIAGYYYDRQYNAFVWTKGKLHDLGTLGGPPYSVAYGINSLGHACGSSLIKSGLYGLEHGFIWTGGRMKDLGTLGGNYSSARSINTKDQVVGYASLSNGAFRAFLYTGGAMTDLGTLGGDYSYANSINDASQVVGSAALPANTRFHAFLWNGSGPFLDLGDLGDNISEALALSSKASLDVGQATVPSNTGYVLYHAFVWSRIGGMQDLNNLISPDSGWVLNQATGVNDGGVIVGYGTRGGQTRAFRLTPL